MLLALDTATTAASIALYDLDQARLLAEYTWLARRRQTQDLLVTAQQMVTQLGLKPQQISALAVTTGPGSFTGVRIAISAAKGIALGLPVSPRIIGLPTLSVTAAPWQKLAASVQPSATLCAYIQAGRGRYNWCFFSAEESLWLPGVAEHEAGRVDEFVAALAAKETAFLWLIGEETSELGEAVAKLKHVYPLCSTSALRRADALAHLAAQHFADGSADDLNSLQPLYLQNP